MSDLKTARWLIGTLTYPDLLALRDDVSRLLAAYEAGGALTGRGRIELKIIKRPVMVEKKDEQGRVTKEPGLTDCGPYAYIRRWAIDEHGRVSLTSSGYYGRGGAEAVAAGLGDELLAAHLQGGEPEGDDFLAGRGFAPPQRRSATKPPATRPVHPLGEEAITAANIGESPIFGHYQQHAPVDAARLVRELRQYEADLASYQAAEQAGLRFRLDNQELALRRQRAGRRQAGQPARRVRRVRD
jgi:hypothetical protein